MKKRENTLTAAVQRIADTMEAQARQKRRERVEALGADLSQAFPAASLLVSDREATSRLEINLNNRDRDAVQHLQQRLDKE